MSHVERMQAEWQQLGSNTKKLGDFIAYSFIFKKLDEQDRRLMEAQLSAMRAYGDVLGLRILRAR